MGETIETSRLVFSLSFEPFAIATGVLSLLCVVAHLQRRGSWTRLELTIACHALREPLYVSVSSPASKNRHRGCVAAVRADNAAGKKDCTCAEEDAAEAEEDFGDGRFA